MIMRNEQKEVAPDTQADIFASVIDIDESKEQSFSDESEYEIKQVDYTPNKKKECKTKRNAKAYKKRQSRLTK